MFEPVINTALFGFTVAAAGVAKFLFIPSGGLPDFLYSPTAAKECQT